MPSDGECAEVLREVRWAGGVACVYCGGRSVVKRGWRGFCQRYKCNGCGRWFNDKTGAVMAHSRLPLRFWFFTAFMMQSKISVKELAETLQRPYNTVFRMVRKIRRNLYLTASTIKLNGIVELDEVYVKAGLKGKRNLKRKSRIRGLKRRGRGTYAVDKPPILGVVERGGLVRLVPMADVAARTVLRRLFKGFDLEDVEALYTDDFPSYNALRSLACHETVNHSIGEYARGKVHTNTVEAEFSVFRPWSATFRGINKENSHLYTAHYNFLRNNRRMDRVHKTVAMLTLQVYA
jgi:transposase-like protein